MSLSVFLWLGLSMIFFGCGEYLSKQFAITQSWKYAAANLMASLCTTLAWFPAISQYSVLSVVGLVWSVLSVLATLFVGIVIFHEPLTTIKVIGIILAITSIVLMSL